MVMVVDRFIIKPSCRLCMSKKGQVSLEYVAVFSLALVASITLVGIFIAQQGNIESDVAQAKATNAVSIVTTTIENVDVMGNRAKRTIRIDFPRQTKEIELTDEYLNIEVETINRRFNVTRSIDATYEGEIRDFGGLHVLEIENVNGTVQVTDR